MSHLGTFEGFSDGALTVSSTFTVPVGATFATVFVGMRGSDGGATTLTSVTMGGESFTLDGTTLRRFDGFQAMQAGYLLSANMPSGSVTATATRSSIQDGMTISVSFFDDAAQQIPTIGLAGNGSGGDPFDTSITMPAAGIISDGIVTSNGSPTFTTNQTGQTLEASPNSSGNCASFSSVRTVSSGSQTMGWDTSGNTDRTSHIVLGIEAGTATPAIDTNDDPIRLGTTSAHTVSNFGSTINAGNIARDGIQIDGTSPSDTAITWAAQAQDLVIPEPGTGATFTLGDGTDTANVTLEFLPETGFTYNTVGTVSGSLVEGDWGFGLGLESNEDGYITRDSDVALSTHNNDGSTTWLDYGTSLVYSWDKNAVVGDDGGLTSITLTNSENPTEVPVLASTKSLSGTIDVAFSRTLTIQSGDAATSWTLTGGADQAEYTLNNSGVLTRTVPNPTEESEVVTVTASNAGGTSNTQTVTITYSEYTGGAFNDRLYAALASETGTLNDRLFKYLRGEGHTGALNDMIFQAGGWQQVLSDLGVI